MRKLVSLLLVLAAASCAQTAPAAGWHAAAGNRSVTLLNTPCTNAKILSAIPANVHNHLNAGQAKIGGETYALCWVSKDAHMLLLYEDGDMGLLPRNLFVETTAI